MWNADYLKDMKCMLVSLIENYQKYFFSGRRGDRSG
jgi:hypothetical protein